MRGRLSALSLLCGLLAAGALSGCGDAGTKGAETNDAATSTGPARVKVGPQPAESGEQAVERIAEAVRNGDCSAPKDIFGPSGVTSAICEELLPKLDPASPPDVKTYGSGAVVKNADGGSTILALDSDRRYKVVTSFGASKMPTVPLKEADAVMGFVVGAIRRDSCDDLLRFALTYSNGGGGKKFCALRPIRQLHRALDRDYTAAPTALGGDGTFAFYGLEVKPYYFTMLFLAAPNDTYFFVTSVRA
jgi:hypothetical protein